MKAIMAIDRDGFAWYGVPPGETAPRYLTASEIAAHEAIRDNRPMGARIVTAGWTYGGDNAGKVPTI